MGDWIACSSLQLKLSLHLTTQSERLAPPQVAHIISLFADPTLIDGKLVTAENLQGPSIAFAMTYQICGPLPVQSLPAQ